MNSTQYKITIQKIEHYEVDSLQPILISERHYTDKEIQEDYNYIARESNPSRYVKKEYGSESIKEQKSKTTDIYEQTVDALNLPKVIFAINDLEQK